MLGERCRIFSVKLARRRSAMRLASCVAWTCSVFAVVKRPTAASRDAVSVSRRRVISGVSGAGAAAGRLAAGAPAGAVAGAFASALSAGGVAGAAGVAGGGGLAGAGWTGGFGAG